MLKLEVVDLHDIARGAAVLACGGGGDPFRGTLSAVQMARQHGAPQVVSIDELDDDDLVAAPFIIGAPLAFLEKFPFGEEFTVVTRELQQAVGGRLAALLPAEIGGINSTLPLALGARLNIPVIDADTMGRAYPEMDMNLLTVMGLSAAPTVVADEHGNSVVVNAATNAWAETLVRTAVVKFGAAAAAIGYPATVRDVRPATIEGSLSRALKLGRGMREAGKVAARVVDVIRQQTGAVELFHGKIIGLEREIVGGLVHGSVLLEGTGVHAGQRMEIDIRNEFLLARVDGIVRAMAPDIITVIDTANGAPLATESLRYGYRITVLGIQCNPRWRTEAGLAVGGPHRFGFPFPYTPIEVLTASGTAPAGAQARVTGDGATR